MAKLTYAGYKCSSPQLPWLYIFLSAIESRTRGVLARRPTTNLNYTQVVIGTQNISYLNLTDHSKCRHSDLVLNKQHHGN